MQDRERDIIVMCPPSTDSAAPTLNSDRNYDSVHVELQGEGCGERVMSPTASYGRGRCRQSTHDADDEDLERASASKKLKRALVLCSFCILLEIVGGSFAGSLAILSDAAHLVSDLTGFASSLLALRTSQWTATPQHSYGYLRLEVLGALVSVQSIWLMTGYIVYESVQRLYLRPRLVDGRLMCFVAALGVAVNLVMIFLLGHGHHHSGGACEGHSHLNFHHHEHSKTADGKCDSRKQNHHHAEAKTNQLGGACHYHGEANSTTIKALKYSHPDEKPLSTEGEEETVRLVSSSTSSSDEAEQCQSEISICCAGQAQSSNEHNYNINLRGAYLHALGDLIQSVGVMITGIAIWIKPEWQFIDLLCSLFFSVIVVSTTFRMIKDVLSILMESTPPNVDVEAVNKGLLAIKGVVSVNQLHIWALTTGTNVLTCHLYIKPAAGAQAKDILHTATRYCRVDQKMKHVTIQVEDTSSSDFEQVSTVGMV